MTQHWKPLDGASVPVVFDDVDEELHAVATDAEIVSEPPAGGSAPKLPGDQTDGPQRRRGRGPLLLVLAVLGALALLALVFSGSEPAEPPQDQPPPEQTSAPAAKGPTVVIGEKKKVKRSPKTTTGRKKVKIPGVGTSSDAKDGKVKIPGVGTSSDTKGDGGKIKIPGVDTSSDTRDGNGKIKIPGVAGS